MHAVFMPYGKKECVDVMFRDMTAQKLNLRFYKEGEPDKIMLVECQLRTLPGGLYEFIFPKEYMDVVLTTLRFHLPAPYNLDRDIKKFGIKINLLKELKEFLKIEDAPKDFKTEQSMPWMMNDVAIIPIGVRYDGEITNPDRPGVILVGWRHEAI